MRRLIGFIGLLAILSLLAIVGDRVAAGYAAERAERELASHGFRSPEVAIRGFPFLTQFAAGEYDEVTVHAAGLRVEAVEVERVAATLRDVRIDSDTGPQEVRAGEMQARGTLPYTEVERAADVPTLRVTRGRGGEVRLTGRVALLGKTFPVAAQGRIEAYGDRLRVIPTGLEVEGAGRLDGRLSSLLKEKLAFDYPIQGLPRGVQVRAVTPGLTGFVVDVSGTDTVLRSP